MKPLGAVRLRSRIVGVSVALAACERHHRHLPRCAGGLVGVEVVDPDGWPVAWGIVGRPVARVLDEAGWVELLRGIVPDGAPPNAASCVLGAAARWARRERRPILTYTLSSEPGASLRGAGWMEAGRTRYRASWSSAGREREQRAGQVAEPKRRWVAAWCRADAASRGWL